MKPNVTNSSAGRAAALLACLTTVIACTSGDTGSASLAEFDPGPTPESYLAGQELYQRNCMSCHGINGAGSHQGPPLVHIIYEPSHHGDASFLLAVQRGVVAHHWDFGNMAPVPGVTPDQVSEIVNYVRWLQRQAGIF